MAFLGTTSPILTTKFMQSPQMYLIEKTRTHPFCRAKSKYSICLLIEWADRILLILLFSSDLFHVIKCKDGLKEEMLTL